MNFRRNRLLLKTVSGIVCFFIIFLFSCNHARHINSRKASSNPHLTYAELRAKYGAIMQTEPEHLQNLKLYYFINKWYGVVYRGARNELDGTDCSGFVNVLFKDVYGKKLEREAELIFKNNCKPKANNNLREGDLVFFKTQHDYIDHVGVYLHNNHFVHASSKLGVMIDDLDEAYYKKTFFKGGSLKY
jgi:cell wall-associated NlpC family hydrolase